jgi:hypothetical protein
MNHHDFDQRETLPQPERNEVEITKVPVEEENLEDEEVPVKNATGSKESKERRMSVGNESLPSPFVKPHLDRKVKKSTTTLDFSSPNEELVMQQEKENPPQDPPKIDKLVQVKDDRFFREGVDEDLVNRILVRPISFPPKPS